METLTDEIRTARKQHRCNWCGNPIQKGEKYRHCVNVDGGFLWHFKEHLRCNEIFEAFYKKEKPNPEECTQYFFEEEAVEELVAYGMCKECPHWRKPDPSLTYDRWRCTIPSGWRNCIDKVYLSLVKRGIIKKETNNEQNTPL